MTQPTSKPQAKIASIKVLTRLPHHGGYYLVLLAKITLDK